VRTRETIVRRLEALTLFVFFFAAPAFAVEAPDPAQLKALERDAREAAAERDKLRGESAGLARDIETIRADLIATAQDIQGQEHSLTVMENRVRELEAQSARMSAVLLRRDGQMTDVLLALERLALHPGDALSLTPLSPADAVRSAILLRAALPHIKQSEVTLQRELGGLYKLRTETTQQKEAAAAAAAALVTKRARLESLEQEKATRRVTLASRGDELDSRYTKMTREAQDLRDLFAKLAEEKAARDKATEAAKAQAAEAAKTQAAEAARAKAAEAARAKAAEAARAKAAEPPSTLAPAPAAKPQSPAPAEHEVAVTRSFAKARGTMPFPVTGSLSGKYGEAAGSTEDPGLRAKGITITTRGGAQVVAPFDGIVAFAGPFRGYGQLLIIEHSEGYHTLLAGMGRIDAVVGSRVLAGEPVGTMESEGAPSLYVELRRDGQPINPLPWLADRAGKISG
jgi:septal ring factor EnvC (AmiA/AmiB activator)